MISFSLVFQVLSISGSPHLTFFISPTTNPAPTPTNSGWVVTSLSVTAIHTISGFILSNFNDLSFLSLYAQTNSGSVGIQVYSGNLTVVQI